MVGRDEEIELLRDGLDQAADGRGSAYFVVGEAGVGKSRLVREVSRQAVARGFSVLTGRAVASGTPVPFRPLAEAVLSGLRRRGEQAQTERGPLLARLLPEWIPPERAIGVHSPVVLGEDLLRLLRELSGERGCLLTLEDLHWADPESLALLEYVADNIAEEPIVCLGTLRGSAEGAGHDLIGSLVDRRVARVVTLPRLGREATLQVARACLNTPDLPAEVVALLGANADGLPFLIEELLAGLVGAGVLVEQDGSWSTTGPVGGRVPPTFAEAVARRMEALPAADRGVLHAAAVLGRRFDWSLLGAVTGSGEPDVLAALRRAVSAQLITAERDGFRFRHALTCDAVLGSLVAPERASLAARALEAVEQSRPDLLTVQGELAAELAIAAGRRSRAAELLLEVGRRAVAAGALATAEATLVRARELVPDDSALAASVDDALTEVLALAGQVDRAFELGNRLLARPEVVATLPASGRELHLRLARAGIAAGRWPAAADHLAAVRAAWSGEAGDKAPSGPGDVAGGSDAWTARLDALGAQVALGRGELDHAGRLATTALATAERTGLHAVACEALEVVGRVARQRDLTAAETAFTRELDMADVHGLELWRMRALHELGTIDQLRTESVDRLSLARQLAVDVGALALVATLDLQIAAGLIKQFRPDEGLAAARASADASRRLRLATLPMALVLQATAHAQRGEITQMDVCLSEALALAPHDLDVNGSAWGHCRATASVLAEDRARALTEMATGAGFLQRSPATVAPPFLGLRVLMLAVEGADITAEAERVRGSAAVRHRIVASLLDYAEAVRLGRTGRGDEAAAAAEDADAGMGPLVMWYQQYARRLTAEAALADGWGTPVDWLREGAAFFAARDELPIAMACRALLRRAGVPVPRTGRGDSVVPADLRALGVTSREVDVLVLVVEGLTNHELGQRLHLSPRTVEKHVASLLAKTGCRRRAQLGAYWARLSG
jgi:DNA-binding CsgD family transcriptional regulator